MLQRLTGTSFPPAAIALVMLAGCLLLNVACRSTSSVDKSPADSTTELSDDFKQTLNRFSFINHNTGKELKDHRIMGRASGSYEQGGTIFDTCIIAFEDRPGGAEADLDFMDLLVEMKCARGAGSVTVRIVQLGLDTIDVHMDGELIDSVRPALEIQVQPLTQ